MFHGSRMKWMFGSWLYWGLAFIFVVLPSAQVSAGTLMGEFIKDHRDLDEIGLHCTLEAWKKPGGLVQIKITAENRALCGGTWEWQVPLHGNLARVKDDPHQLEFTFFPEKVVVDGKKLENDHCPLTGTYILYGTMVKPLPEVVQDIRRHYAYINEHLENFDFTEKELSGFSSEGGSYKAYGYMGHPKKIMVEHFGEMGKVVQEYYYFNNLLLFSFRKTFKYEKPFGEVASIQEDRFYFHYGKMIKWLDHTQKDVSAKDNQFQAEQERIVLNADQYAGFLEKDGKVISHDEIKD